MEFIDQMNRTIRLENFPKRIVSLVPSQTELLFDLGLGDRVVGITKFCIHPDDWFRNKSRVGGTKDVDYQKVLNLKPDLIIGNNEENQKENIESLMDICPIWMSDISDLSQALEMILSVGELTDKRNESIEIKNQIEQGFERVVSLNKPLNCLYFIWRNPFMAVGKTTFVDDMLQNVCGFKNLSHDLGRYPEIELSEMTNVDCVLLSSEPYPFKEKHLEEIQNAFPNALIKLVDGEYFSWYGSRLMGAPNYFNKLVEEINSSFE